MPIATLSAPQITVLPRTERNAYAGRRWKLPVAARIDGTAAIVCAAAAAAAGLPPLRHRGLKPTANTVAMHIMVWLLTSLAFRFGQVTASAPSLTVSQWHA